MSVVLNVQGISKSFGGIHAVRDVSFEVRKGEMLGLIGPNGSGKSTLFNCVLGQLKPNTGRVEVNGRDVNGMRACDLNKLGVGRTFQIVQPFAAMTVEENIMVGAFHATATSAKRGRSRARPPSEWGSRRGSEARRAVSPSAASSGSRSPA